MMKGAIVAGAILSGSAQMGASELHLALEARGLVDPYLEDVVADVARRIVGASRPGRKAQVNGPPHGGRVDVYIVDARGLRGTPVAGELGGLEGNALARRDLSSIFVDRGLLRELVALNRLFWERNASMPEALAAFEVRGEDGLRELWDPGVDGRVASRQPGQPWLISLRGVLAFLIAHELGHVDEAPAPTERSRPPRFEGRDADIRSLCPDLVDPRARDRRRAEADADAYAVRLLGALGGPAYESGVRWYLSYNLERAMIRAVPLASPQLTPLLRQRYGPAFEALAAAGARRSGPVEVFYDRTHPDALSRLARALGSLYDEPAEPLLAVWASRVQRECLALEQRNR